MSRAVFLDRDGVILNDSGYMYRLADLSFAEGAISGLKMLGDEGFALIVVTNQSGIGRGYFSEHEYHKFNTNFVEHLAQQGVHLTAAYHCPHAPALNGVEKCDCRKPMPGLLLRAIAAHNIDPRASFMVGDRATDIAAGIAAGVLRCVLISSHAAVNEVGPLMTARSLKEAADQIIKYNRNKHNKM